MEQMAKSRLFIPGPGVSFGAANIQIWKMRYTKFFKLTQLLILHG